MIIRHFLRSNFTIFILRSNFHMRLFGLIFVSTTIALLTISLPISASSFTLTLKIILLSFVSVISRYFAITLPFSNFNSTGLGLDHSACKLFSTYSNPAGISSSTLTSTSFPFSTVFLKLIRYSISSPNFGFIVCKFLCFKLTVFIFWHNCYF